MPGYWWECESNGSHRFDISHFHKNKMNGYTGMASFIKDVMAFQWNRNELLQHCDKCKRNTMRITYKYSCKSNTNDKYRVITIVGLNSNTTYIPMMWETCSVIDEYTYYDFKYIIGRSVYGLNKPAIFTRQQLNEIIKLYGVITGQKAFPYDND
jgi:hypothetical protein